METWQHRVKAWGNDSTRQNGDNEGIEKDVQVGIILTSDLLRLSVSIQNEIQGDFNSWT